jgi:hypothetical protein
MATYTLISSNVLASSAASVTFSAIPATYTDLVLRASMRSSTGTITTQPNITFNGVGGTSYSRTFLQGVGTTPSSGRNSSTNAQIPYIMNGNTSTASTFSNAEIYIPNYTVAINKQISIFGVVENNSATANSIDTEAGLFTDTTAITSITLTASFVSGCTFYLYGISNA